VSNVSRSSAVGGWMAGQVVLCPPLGGARLLTSRLVWWRRRRAGMIAPPVGGAHGVTRPTLRAFDEGDF
jgi:hypothetical protein